MPNKGECDNNAVVKIREWRDTIFHKHYSYTLFTPSAILDDSIVQLLSSVGPLSTQQYESLLKSRWTWWDVHGGDLCNHLAQISIRYVPLSRKRKSCTAELDIAVPSGEVVWISEDSEELQPSASPLDNMPYPGALLFYHCRVVGKTLNTSADPHNPERAKAPRRTAGRARTRASAPAPVSLSGPTQTHASVAAQSQAIAPFIVPSQAQVRDNPVFVVPSQAHLQDDPAFVTAITAFRVTQPPWIPPLGLDVDVLITEL